MTVYDFRKAAYNLSSAFNSLQREIHRLDFLHCLDVEKVVSAIKREQEKVRFYQMRYWLLSKAEDAHRCVVNDEELLVNLYDWIDENYSGMKFDATKDAVLFAIDNGWEPFPEPSDADTCGEPPITANEMHENARKEKLDSRK